MIDSNSRYAMSVPLPAIDGRSQTLSYFVFRDPPENPPNSFQWHEWREGDRWDLLAVMYLNNSLKWYVLVDYNPHIEDPLAVEPGDQILVPVSGT